MVIFFYGELEGLYIFILFSIMNKFYVVDIRVGVSNYKYLFFWYRFMLYDFKSFLLFVGF